ncbi:hypothetical protein K493DRAFT_315315, partial [Basidiobolus meristosporus CBS 931.73]
MKYSRLGERRWCTIIALMAVLGGLLCLFILYPIISDNKPKMPSSLHIRPMKNSPFRPDNQEVLP